MLCITPLYLGLFSIWTPQLKALRWMRLCRGTGQRRICNEIGSFPVGASFVLNAVGPLPPVASQEKGLNLRPCMNIFLINMVFKVSPKSSQNRLQNDRPLQFPWNGGWVHFRRHGKRKFQRLYFFQNSFHLVHDRATLPGIKSPVPTSNGAPGTCRFSNLREHHQMMYRNIRLALGICRANSSGLRKTFQGMQTWLWEANIGHVNQSRALRIFNMHRHQQSLCEFNRVAC